MSVQSYIHQPIPASISIHHVSWLKPFSWLTKAWQDIKDNPMASLAYGLAVTVLSMIVITMASSHIYILAATISGFMLIGPILSAGLCEISKRHETEMFVSFDDSLNCLDRSENALIQFATLLLSISIFWFLISVLLLSLFMGNVAPSVMQTLWGNFFDYVSPMELLLYTAVGSILAGFVFIISVVAIPAIIDKNVSEIEAIRISIRAIKTNPASMLVWAMLIVILCLIGFATFMAGLVVIYPLLGHATWHAYRDVIKSES